jgi:hypothetical protein
MATLQNIQALLIRIRTQRIEIAAYSSREERDVLTDDGLSNERYSNFEQQSRMSSQSVSADLLTQCWICQRRRH